MSAPRALGGYQLLVELKSGGMGEVHLARKRGAAGFERLVALKTIRRDLRETATVRTMFLDEARLLARLSHAAIAQVFDFGEDGDVLYLAMEYVAGIHFRQLGRMRPPPAVVARAMAEALRGLHAAHELVDVGGRALQVVHRDVTPENLMLTFEGGVKVLDFGIALMRGREAPVTELGTLKGKPPYLSPEQLKNESLDRRSDLFSAAAVLWELLAGTPLFEGPSAFAVARAIEHEPIVAPSAIVGALPAGLDEAVMRGLERDPARRWPTALDFADDLDRVAATDPLSLEAFARANLAEELAGHRQWLRRVLADEREGGAAMGRPSGVRTAVGADAPSAIREPPRRRSRTAGVAGAALAAAFALGAGLWWRSTHRPPPPPTTAAAALDAAVLDAAAAPPPAVVAVAEPADAPAVPDPPAEPPRARPRTPRASGSPAPPAPPAPPAIVKPPDRPAPPGAPPGGIGWLKVAADPYALVKIDGVDRGTTPILKLALPAGVHEVVLKSPDSGATRLQRTVEIVPGKTEQIILR